MKSHTQKQKGPSQRQLRVGEQIKQIVAEALQRGHVPDTENITVSEVRVTPDLRNAKAYVMTLGGGDMEGVLSALNDESQSFSKEINRQSNMKFTPRVTFVRDESFDEAQRIDDLLRSVHIPEDSGGTQ